MSAGLYQNKTTGCFFPARPSGKANSGNRPSCPAALSLVLPDFPAGKKAIFLAGTPPCFLLFAPGKCHEKSADFFALL